MNKGLQESDRIESDMVSLCKDVDRRIPDAMIQSEDLMPHQGRRVPLAVQLHIAQQYGPSPPSPGRSTPPPYPPPYTSCRASGMALE